MKHYLDDISVVTLFMLYKRIDEDHEEVKKDIEKELIERFTDDKLDELLQMIKDHS